MDEVTIMVQVGLKSFTNVVAFATSSCLNTNIYYVFLYSECICNGHFFLNFCFAPLLKLIDPCKLGLRRVIRTKRYLCSLP